MKQTKTLELAAGQMLGVQGTASKVNKEEICDVLKSHYTKTRTNNTNKSRPTLRPLNLDSWTNMRWLG